MGAATPSGSATQTTGVLGGSTRFLGGYPLVMTDVAIENGHLYGDFPIKHGDFS